MACSSLYFIFLFQEREELLALLDGGDVEAAGEVPGLARPRQKMSRKFDSLGLGEESTVRTSRSRPVTSKARVSSAVKRINDGLKERRKGSRRFRHRFDNLVEPDVDEKLVKNELLKPVSGAKVRARSREGVLKRRKGVKKSKINQLQRGENVEKSKEKEFSSEVLKQRRVRVRPGQKEEIILNASKPQQIDEVMTKSEFANRLQRRLRPRKKVHKEVRNKSGESENLSRFRAANKDLRSKVKQL